MADDSSSISFFIHQDSDILPLFEIFLDAIIRQLRKIGSNLLAHIHQEDRLLGPLYVVIKTFVIHSAVYVRIKKRE